MKAALGGIRQRIVQSKQSLEASFNQRFQEQHEKVIALLGGWVALYAGVKVYGGVKSILFSSKPHEQDSLKHVLYKIEGGDKSFLVREERVPLNFQPAGGAGSGSSKYGFEIPTAENLGDWADKPENIEAFVKFLDNPELVEAAMKELEGGH